MRRLVAGLLAGAFSLGLMQIAAAADLPVKAPIAPVSPIYNWAGFYIGGHAGYEWDNTSWNFPAFEFYNTAAGQGFTTRPKGFEAGFHGGYNFQSGPWVYGIEVAYDPTNAKETRIGPVVAIFPADSFATKIDNLVTVTGRLGYANGAWLFYGKGGWANAHIGLDVVSGAPVAGVTAGGGKRLNGGTAGAGVEYMLTPNVILGLEYDWVGLQSASFASTTSLGGPFHINSGRVNLNIVSARVSYKF